MGETILIPPYIPHVWHFDPNVTDNDGCIANISIFFEDSTLNGLAALLPEMKDRIDRLRSLTEAIAYSGNALKNIVSTIYRMRSKTPLARIPDMLKLVTLISDTKNGYSVGHNNTQTRTEQRLEKIRTFCACNYARDISLDEISQYAGMNKSAFCTFMKHHTGMTFSEFVNKQRLSKAIELIKNTDENIADIAYSVGFTNVTYFNRLFRAIYTCTPKSFRQ